MSSARFRRRLRLQASLTTILAAGIAGCGATAHHSATTPVATTAAAPASTPRAPGSTGQSGSASVPADDVAVVNGTPITNATFEHWLQVTTYSNAAGSGRAPVVPDPPTFTHCIAEARRIGKLAHEATQKLKTDCEVLLSSDEGQTMDFLIKNVWLEQAATQAHLDPSPSEVRETFAAQKRKEFEERGRLQRVPGGDQADDHRHPAAHPDQPDPQRSRQAGGWRENAGDRVGVLLQVQDALRCRLCDQRLRELLGGLQRLILQVPERSSG